MKKEFLILFAAMTVAAVVSRAEEGAAALVPQPYYGDVAQEVVNRLERRHVLRRQFDDEMSRRAWTNLVSSYDFNR